MGTDAQRSGDSADPLEAPRRAILRATVIVYDPVYFEAPYIRTSMFWIDDPNLVMPPYPCEEATETVVERGTAALPARPEPAPRTGSKGHGCIRNAVRGEAWRRRNDVSRVIAKMKGFPRPPQVPGEQGARGQ